MSPYVAYDEQGRIDAAAQHVLLNAWGIRLCPHLHMPMEYLHSGSAEYAQCVACRMTFIVSTDRIFVRSSIKSNTCAVRSFELPLIQFYYQSPAASTTLEASEPQWLRDMEIEMAT